MIKKNVIIVGSGFSAGVLCLHLVSNRLINPVNVLVLGKGDLGSGWAYSNKINEYRLNVKSDLMKIWNDDPEHFSRWSSINIVDIEAHTDQGSFYKRKEFHNYFKSCLSSNNVFKKIKKYDEKVIDINKSNDSKLKWRVICKSGNSYFSNILILATGFPKPKWPFKIKVPDNSLIKNPWKSNIKNKVLSQDDVLLIGGGLTAMDCLHFMERRNHKGKIVVITPFGNLPPMQTNWKQIETIKWPEIFKAVHFIKFMRENLEDTDWKKIAWQEKFESLRIGFNDAWQKLGGSQKKLLIKYFRHFWTNARFRSSPQTYKSAEKLFQSNQLIILRGRALSIEKYRDKLLMKTKDNKYHVFDKVINCSGFGENNLINKLIKNEIVGADITKKGILVNSNLEILDPKGNVVEGFFSLGPLNVGSLGDVVAANTISNHAKKIVENLALLK